MTGNSLWILKLILLLLIPTISIYVFKERNKWVNYSQGIKPLIVGLLILVVSSILLCIEKNIFSFIGFLKVATLHPSIKFSVGLTKLIVVSYVVILYGIEILLIVYMKKLKTRDK